jgi:hypothetical protein
MSEMRLLYHNTRKYTSVCIMEVITQFEEALFPHPPYSPDLPTTELNLFCLSNNSL